MQHIAECKNHVFLLWFAKKICMKTLNLKKVMLLAKGWASHSG